MHFGEWLKSRARYICFEYVVNCCFKFLHRRRSRSQIPLEAKIVCQRQDTEINVY